MNASILVRGSLKTCSSLVAVAALVQAAGASLPPNPNVRLVFPYPQHDYCFQDRRSIHDILANRLPREIANAGDPEDLGPGLACFDPTNPPSAEVMEQVRRYIEGGYASRYQVAARWARGLVGDPIALTWSFVPDGTVVGDASAPGGAGASSLFSTMDSRFASVGGRTTWVLQFQRCFDRWQALSGVDYTRVRNAAGNDWDDGAAWGNAGGTNRGDVRIGMKNIDGTNGILAYNQFPDNGDMVIDSSENWATGATSYLFLRDVVLHEHGHGLGFSHVCPQGTASSGGAKLMAPFVDTSFDGPQQDDIRAVHLNYGDPYEPNDSSAAPTALGALAAGASVNLGTVPSPTPASAGLLSLERLGETDWYSFTIDAPRLINFSITPVGSTYQQNAQNTSCTSDGTTSNGLAAADMAFDVRNSLNTITYRSVNAAAAGSAESTTGLLLSPAGTFLIRVFSNTFTEVQSYRLSLTAQNVAMAPTATDGTFTDFVRVTWPNVISDAEGYQISRSLTDATSGTSVIGTVAGTVRTFDDTTAVPGTTYYYFIKARQPGNVNYRYMTASGDAGFRPIVNQPPVANAGPDQTVTDENRTGAETVTLNGSASTDDNGITSYVWRKAGVTIATGVTPTVNLDVGVNTITLTVSDAASLTSSDSVVVTVQPGCFADYNLDGGVDGGDVTDFFTDWEAGNAAADANADGGVDGADIETFFAVWSAGGC
ncbi:MAG: matrixin family metalloprotease [Phycisphaerae bacterium]